jgi:hypothetical protein
MSSSFPGFIRKVRVKSIKIGPITWDILPAVELPVDQQIDELKSSPEIKSIQAPKAAVKQLQELIYALENFASNPEAIFYIGQTLVQCDSFLRDNGIVGEPLDLCEALITQMDSDPRLEEGLFDPRVSVSKINKLKRSLKSFQNDIRKFEQTSSASE